jgi:hypothetical protein
MFPGSKLAAKTGSKILAVMLAPAVQPSSFRSRLRQPTSQLRSRVDPSPHGVQGASGRAVADETQPNDADSESQSQLICHPPTVAPAALPPLQLSLLPSASDASIASAPLVIELVPSRIPR